MKRCALLALLAAGSVWGQGIAAGSVVAAPKVSSGKPWNAKFTDIGLAAGFTQKLTAGSELKQKYIIEANGSGVAWIDYDEDGRLDVFFVNGSRLEKMAAPATNLLYRNEGGGKFRDVTREAGLARSGWGNGVCTGDVDRDGHLDLYVTYWGENVLYRSTGKGRYEDVTAKAGAGSEKGDWSTGCTFLDYDRDGWLDLFYTTYVGFDPAKTPLPGAAPFCTWKGAPVFCGPRGLPYGKARLLRNRGDGTFEDVTQKSGAGKAQGFYGFTAVATDLDGDGWQDIYVACDSTPSLFFRNRGDGTFREVATEAGLAFNEHGSEQAGMGLALADLDGDGRVDVMKTNFSGDYPNLYRNLGKGVFADLPLRAGLAVNPNYVLWGVGMEDLDNDGQRDVLQVAGHVFLDVAKIDGRESFKQKRLVYRNLGGGVFEDVSNLAGPGIGAAHSSRGAAFGDFDNDGDMDVAVMNLNEPPTLLRNDLAPQGNWLKVELDGIAVGAQVVVEAGGGKQMGVFLSQSSYLSVNDRRLHFGLGAETRAERVVVRWPSGGVGEFGGLEAGRLYRLREGVKEAEVRPLPR